MPDDPKPSGANAEADASSPSTPGSSGGFVLAATILASAMAFIDGSIVTIALPAIQAEFGAELASLQWVVNGYTLMLGALLLAGGGLGDRVGRRRIFVAGLILFTAASILCAAAPTIELLIAGRVAQGTGAAALVPQSLAIIAATFPREVRGRAIGTWAAASAVTTALGPPLGGFLIDSWSWRAAFWINIPLAAGALWLTLRYIPENRDDAATGPIDWTGTAVAVLSFGALTVGLTWLTEADGNRALALLAMATGGLGLALFVAVELRAANPIMPLAPFRSRTFTGANVVTLFLYGALTGVLFLLPFELIGRRGMSATAVGLTLLPLGLIIGLFSRPAGALADRFGPRLFLAAGSAVVAVACFVLALGLESFWRGAVLPVILLSAGMAVAVSPLTTAVMNSAPDGQSGAASGINNAASRLAGLLAVAVLGALAEHVFRRGAPGGSFAALASAGETAPAAM
ncbi:MAG: MFS transporter [Rhizobiales bacterium]|nr:MFS transporter [Hyphomicrobiales bacterium]